MSQTVARGEYKLGFQTMSELLPINGVDQLGPIPAGAQTLVSFSAPIAVGAKEPVAGLALIKYLSPGGGARDHQERHDAGDGRREKITTR